MIIAWENDRTARLVSRTQIKGREAVAVRYCQLIKVLCSVKSMVFPITSASKVLGLTSRKVTYKQNQLQWVDNNCCIKRVYYVADVSKVNIECNTKKVDNSGVS